jgi:hypothetical protein
VLSLYFYLTNSKGRSVYGNDIRRQFETFCLLFFFLRTVYICSTLEFHTTKERNYDTHLLVEFCFKTSEFLHNLLSSYWLIFLDFILKRRGIIMSLILWLKALLPLHPATICQSIVFLKELQINLKLKMLKDERNTSHFL